jgi:hypothetical protein
LLFYTSLADHLIHHPDKPDGVFLIGTATPMELGYLPKIKHERITRYSILASPFVCFVYFVVLLVMSHDSTSPLRECITTFQFIRSFVNTVDLC